MASTALEPFSESAHSPTDAMETPSKSLSEKNISVENISGKVHSQPEFEYENIAAKVQSQFTQSFGGSAKLTPVSLVKSWLAECVFCIAGLVLFIIIIVVLWLHDQKRQPQWALGITLNALLALLTTLSKAFFMIAMAEVLSQWKWNIYNTPQGRSFHDFTLIDLASRGFLGSCMLLWRFKWQHPVSIAAIVSIISVMTSPLTQQAIDYPTRLVIVNETASVAATRHWTPLEISDERMQVDAALNQALHAGSHSVPSPIEAVCPTARCTFEPYESLAMCAKIADVSSYLEISRTEPDDGLPHSSLEGSIRNTDDEGDPTPMRYVKLPNNITFDQNFPYTFISAVSSGSMAFEDDEAYDTALVNIYIIHTRSDDLRGDDPELPPEDSPLPSDPQFGAFEVMMHMCVNEYETSVEEGQSRTSIRRTRAKALGSGRGGNATIDRIPTIACDPAQWDGVDPFDCHPFDSTGSVLLAGVGSDSREDGLEVEVSSLLNEVANAIVYTTDSLYARYQSDGLMRTAYKSRWTRQLRSALYGKERNVTDPTEQAKMLKVYWDGVATSLSNVIRTTNETHVFPGTAWENEVYVNIRWGWLSFLAAELVLVIAFTVFTAFMTHRDAVPVLKSSALAAFLAPDAETQHLIGSIDNLGSAKEKSKGAHVRFDNRNLILIPDNTGRQRF